jgi:hypothetical protein
MHERLEAAFTGEGPESVSLRALNGYDMRPPGRFGAAFNGLETAHYPPTLPKLASVLYLSIYLPDYSCVPGKVLRAFNAFLQQCPLPAPPPPSQMQRAVAAARPALKLCSADDDAELRERGEGKRDQRADGSGGS